MNHARGETCVIRLCCFRDPVNGTFRFTVSSSERHGYAILPKQLHPTFDAIAPSVCKERCFAHYVVANRNGPAIVRRKSYLPGVAPGQSGSSDEQDKKSPHWVSVTERSRVRKGG